MQTILEQIIRNKKREVEGKKKKISASVLMGKIEKPKPKQSFKDTITHPKDCDIALIAELKFQSPAEGVLGNSDELEKRVMFYQEGRADAISVVVDKKYFGGELSFIPRIRNVVNLPILAKDFIIDPYQIYEMKSMGADAILLIAKIISPEVLKKFVDLSYQLNIEPVVEIGNQKEMPIALQTKAKCIAINARDLTNFTVNIQQASRLVKQIPDDRIALGFSGVQSRTDVDIYKNAGAKAVLVGTSLMKAKDPKKFIQQLKEM